MDHEQRIAELLALEKGWNSYGADPINPAAVERMRPFLKRANRPAVC